MNDMTPAKATALRKPFPPESVGKLPKPYKKDSPKGNCNDCGGYHGLPAVHLDYAGHAAVTDRLLTVDPNWSWEPMAFDQFGSPQCDRDGNLWIRLTICGVTRLGVGDGSTMKERIGDAIRNSAMRFGVGLDLWAKENLVEFAQAATATHAQVVDPVVDSADPPSGYALTPPKPEPDDLLAGLEAQVDAPMTAKTRGAMFAEFGKHKVPEAAQLAGINSLLGTSYTSRGDLTEAHAKRVISDLKKRPATTTAGATS